MTIKSYAKKVYNILKNEGLRPRYLQHEKTMGPESFKDSDSEISVYDNNGWVLKITINSNIPSEGDDGKSFGTGQKRAEYGINQVIRMMPELKAIEGPKWSSTFQGHDEAYVILAAKETRKGMPSVTESNNHFDRWWNNL